MGQKAGSNDRGLQERGYSCLRRLARWPGEGNEQTNHFGLLPAQYHPMFLDPALRRQSV